MLRCNAKRPPPALVAEAAVSQGCRVFRVCARGRRAYDDLLPARITSRHIHVLANHSAALEQLPEASLLQGSDVVHSLERGLPLGGATGALPGLVALVYPPAELAIAGGALFGSNTARYVSSGVST